MKKVLYLVLISVAVISCKKTEFSPEGPTDVRVKNISDVTFKEVIVKIKEETDTLGDIVSGDTSEYHRFEIAYSKAEISAKINGILFSTGAVDYTYMDYKGQVRLTYVVYISSMTKKELTIDDVKIEEPLVLK